MMYGTTHTKVKTKYYPYVVLQSNALVIQLSSLQLHFKKRKKPLSFKYVRKTLFEHAKCILFLITKVIFLYKWYFCLISKI